MVIRYNDGSHVEAVIYALEGSILRAAVAGLLDIVEFKLVKQEWISESGNAVTFEFTTTELPDTLPLMIGAATGHCVVGGDCLLRRMSSSSSTDPLN